MPSMFSRRRGNSALPPVDRSTSAAANAAASQAFITKSQSMTSLSSAAAAAALRSLTTTPEPVGSIQTKRMVRRGSQSSINSGSFSTRGGAGATARSTAVGRTNSMTDRTFRTPSPGGRNGAPSPAYDPNAPPVPAIPRSVSNGHLRSSSVEAPPRVVSPTPDSGRAMSMDRRSMQPQGASKKPPRLSNVAEEVEAADRRNSVNFSRPISPPASPTTAGPPKKYTHGTGGWYSGASGAAASKGAYQQPNVKKKVTSNVASQAQQAEPETIMVFDPNTRTFVAHLKPAPTKQQPPSPVTAKPTAPRWDPSTRTVVPAAAPATGGLGGLIGTATAPKSAQTASTDPKLNPPPRNPLRVSPTADEFPKTTTRAMSLQAGGGSAQQYVAHRKGSLEIPGAGRGRNTSLSPQRSAHFSPSPIIEAQKHEPPARAISPVKSAMKHSPASSIRTTSPLPPSALSKVAASDISDTNSLYSQDGMSTKGKKSARVSFDEKAREINSATAASPAKALDRDDDDTDDEIMRPRPALPSFGSVRRNRPASPEIAEKVTEMPPERHEVSSDHAVGGILANAQAEKLEQPSEATFVAEEPFEPSITSTPAKAPTPAIGVEDFAAQPEKSTPEQPIDVPGIALMPPTPVLDDEQKQLSLQEEQDDTDGDKRLSKDSMSGIAVPGGWSDSASKTASTISSDQPATAADLDAIEEDTSDPEFSDAAEDLDDNGGYASLNAIANSPVATTADKKATVAPPESPTALRGSDEQTRATGDWTEATAYWSQLSKAQREQIEREHLSSDDEARPAEEKKPRKKKSAMKPGTETAPPVQPIKPALKKTMRAQPAAAPAETASTSDDGTVRLRRSMRDAPMSAQTMRRGNPERQRPQSTPVPPRAQPAKPATNRLSQANPATSTAKPDVYTAKLQSKYNNDSDSESSFKKKRRQGGSTMDNQGRYTMKRSMRAGSIDQPRDARPSSPDRVPKGSGKTFSLRSLSPSGSLFNRKRPEEIRQSLRSGASASETNLRTSLRAPPKQRAAPAPTRSKFRSRFADSDDSDEDDRPSRSFFSSRFADSDDDSDPGSPAIASADLRPVRGIPRKRGQQDGDSTDLEDEDDGAGKKKSGRGSKIPLVPDPADVEKAMEAARKKLGIPEVSTKDGTNAQQGSALNRGSLRKPAEETPEPKSRPEDIHFGLDRKKKGLMGSILRRNRNSTQSVPTMGSMAIEPAPPLPTHRLAETTKPSTPTTPAATGSAAPATTASTSTSSPVGRFLRRGRAKRTLSNVSTATAPPNVSAPPPVPDLKESDHWPLPAPNKVTANGVAGGDERPNTSDGVSDSQGVKLGRTMRNGETARTKSVRIAGVDGEIEDPNAVYSSRTGRKKKFGKLRRAFGLND